MFSRFCGLVPKRQVSHYAILLSGSVNETIDSEPTTNSADFDPIFPDLSPFLVSENRRLFNVCRG